MKEIVFAEKISLYKCANDPSAILKKQDLQIDLFEPTAVRFSAGDYIVLDFGKEMCGSTRILTFEPAGARVRIRHGERLTECCSELLGKTNAFALRLVFGILLLVSGGYTVGKELYLALA
jgi:hypothetical protein